MFHRHRPLWESTQGSTCIISHTYKAYKQLSSRALLQTEDSPVPQACQHAACGPVHGSCVDDNVDCRTVTWLSLCLGAPVVCMFSMCQSLPHDSVCCCRRAPVCREDQYNCSMCSCVCGPAADEGAQAAAASQAAAAAAGSQPYYMKQTIGNACGTIAMLHAIGNNKERAGTGEGGGHRQHTIVGVCRHR
jgi:hypothetical protein